MSRTVTAFSCGLLATALAAQGTSVATIAATPIAAATSVTGGASTFEGVAQNRAIGASPNHVFLFTSQTTPTGSLSASSICYPTLAYDDGIGVNFFARANARGASGDQAGTSASAQQQGLTFGPQAIVCTFRSAPGTAGNVILSFRQSAAASGSTAMSLDIGNDNSVELQSSVGVRREFPFTFGASGTLAVRVTNDCQAIGDGTPTTQYSWTEIWIGFMPDLRATCTFTPYGTGCGPQLAGGDVEIGNNRVITMLATGCHPNSPVLVATGTQQLNLVLPGGCSLLSNATVIALANADGTGLATASWTVPVTAVSTSFHQFLPLALIGGNLVLTASNGVRVDCAR